MTLDIETEGSAMPDIDLSPTTLTSRAELATDNPERLVLGYYPETERVKVAAFNRLATVSELEDLFLQANDLAAASYDTPLVQLRAVLTDNEMEQLARSGLTNNVNVVMPYRDQLNSRNLHLVYITAEHPGRRAYEPTNPENRLTGAEAFARAEARRLAQFPDAESREAFLDQTLEQLETTGGQMAMVYWPETVELPTDLVTGQMITDFPWQREEYIATLADHHLQVFENSHDPAQQSVDGQREIVAHNPVLLTYDQEVIRAVGLLEADSNFDPTGELGGIVLAEPTYSTRDEHRGAGYSTAMRLLLRRCLNSPYFQATFGDWVPFSESILWSSFQIARLTGDELGHEAFQELIYYLGNAYARIGPAASLEDTGLIPMGFTAIIPDHLRSII